MSRNRSALKRDLKRNARVKLERAIERRRIVRPGQQVHAAEGEVLDVVVDVEGTDVIAARVHVSKTGLFDVGTEGTWLDYIRHKADELALRS